jgi:hypothetical protein
MKNCASSKVLDLIHARLQPGGEECREKENRLNVSVS